MKRRALCLALWATACQDTSHFEPIVVDIAANCNEVEVLVDARDLDPGDGTRVLVAASEHPDRSGWWLLVSAQETSEDPHTLQLWHLTGGSIDLRVPLGLPPDLVHALTLRPGPRSGEAWLMRRSEGLLQLWHVDANADDPLVGVSSDLGSFPATNDLCRHNEFVFESRCPTGDWHRDLVFLDGSPFLFSVPPFSPDSTMTVYLGDLGLVAPSRVALLQERAVPFSARCDPELSLEDFTVCEERNRALTYEAIEVTARQLEPRARFTRSLVLRESAIDGIRTLVPEAVLVSVGLVDDNISGSLVRIETAFGVPVPGPPAGLAIDRFATYVLHGTGDGRPQLTRMPNLGPGPEPITHLELSSDVQLLQLDDDIALGRIEDGTWSITKLFPDAPAQSKVTEHREATPFVRIDPAGPGAFFAHREEGGPDLLRVRCVER